MYFVVEVGQLVSSTGKNLLYCGDIKIIKHIKGRLSASEALVNEARRYVCHQSGECESNKARLIDINKIEDMQDKSYEFGYYLFRWDDNVHIYHKRAEINKSYLYGSYVTEMWEYLKTFQLVNYDHVDNIPNREVELEMTKTVPSVPKLLKSLERVNLMNELVSSKRYKECKNLYNKNNDELNL